MKNRALFLALSNDIFSKQDFADRVGIEMDQVDSLFYEKNDITPDTIKAVALYFNVSVNYVLCQDEAEGHASL